MSLDGVLANPNLVTFLNSLHGKQVLVETKSGQHFVGVFGASSPELEIGLTYAWERTSANKDNILPKKSEVKEKMVFKFSDVVTVSSVWSEEKTIKGFATDRDYHSKNGRVENENELEIWEGEDEGEEIESYAHMPDQRQSYQKNGGWGVNEMFDANARLHGVQSTFEEDMSQYTTVDFEATEEEKAKADIIAREIEGSTRSSYYSRLENDDDERDLDKITTEEDLDPGRGGKRGNKAPYGNSNNGRNRGGGSGGGTPGGNKRAEGLRGDGRRGSGQQQQPRYSQGTYTPRGGSYSAAGKRNSTGDEFGGEWQNPPKEPQQARAKEAPKVFENTNYTKGRMDKIGKGDKPSTGRVDGLKQWNQEFSNAYKQNKSEETKEQSPVEPTRPQQSSSGNAWNNGPPSSLLNSQSVHNVTSSQESQGHSEEVKEVAESVTQLNLGENKEGEVEKEKTEPKKFTFNPDAPAFTPRQHPQPPTTPTQMQPIQMGIVPGVQLQGPLPPGVTMVPAAQTMIGPWPQQGYVQMQSGPYPVYVQPQPMMSNVPLQGPRGNGGVPPVGNYTNQPTQRRNGPPNQQMMVPNGQWTNQMVVQPMTYYQYQPGQQNSQQFPNNPQIVPQSQQQAMSNQMYQQPRYQQMTMPQGQQPQQGRQFQQGGQQGTHPEQNGQYQSSVPPSSATSTTGPNSQPPTPGPQPPTAASPAQPRGSPPPQPPVPQQFQQGPPTHIPPQHNYYPVHPYMYNQQGGMIVYGSVPMGHVHPEGQPHSQIQSMEMQPHQQYHEQYGQYVQTGPAYYQQQPQQPMSRQNSVPQNYNGQPAPVNPTPSHPSSTAPPQPTPPAAPQQN